MNFNIDREAQQTMHFVLKTPPLQHLAAVKIVTTLCNQRDIFYQISQSHSYLSDYGMRQFNGKEWQVIEEKVKTKVGTLTIPPSCKQQLINIIKPIRMEITDWCHYHYPWLDILLYNHVCWSMHGTVDYAKTVQSVVKDERVHVERRYELACVNCLVDEARELFPRVGKYPCVRPTRVGKYPTVSRQQFVLPGRQSTIMHQNMFHMIHCVRLLMGDHVYFAPHMFSCRLMGLRGIAVTTETLHASSLSISGTMCKYWYERLSPGEKEHFLEARLWSTGFRASSLLYYSSLMNDEQQGRMFGDCYRSRAVLRCLLGGWPLQSLFMEAAKCGWRCLNSQACTEVLLDIIRKIRNGFNDYDYAQLFWEGWRLTSAEHKHHFLDSNDHLKNLMATERVEFIQLVLNQAPSHCLKELVEKKYDKISAVLMDESVISKAALMEYKVKIALNSSNEPPDEEKRLRSEYVSRLVDMTMESREKSGSETSGFDF